MLDIFKQYATDEALENNGTWFPVGTARLLVARAGNRAYSKALTKAVEKDRVILDIGDDAADAASDKIMIDVMASTILLGWEKVGFRGVETPYSVDAAKTALSVKDFRKLVTDLSQNVEAYKVKEEQRQGEV